MAEPSMIDAARRMTKAQKRYSFPVVKTKGPTELPKREGVDLHPTTTGEPSSSKRYPPAKAPLPKINGLAS